ncbi:MAG: extracellular solute-binding protein, partial [bacterium]
MIRAWMLLLFLCAVPVAAQTKGGDKEWQEAVSAGKKEGKVIIAGSPDPVMRNEIIPKFTARYGIPVEFIAGRSSQIVSRVETERSAGIYNIDVYLAGPDTTANELYGGKLIDPLKPLLVMPEVADSSKWKTGKVWFVDPEERFVVRPFSSVASLLFINTDQVKPDELRSAQDLLNAKWRGKISTEDPTTTGAGANMAARLYNQVGEDFVKSLYLDQKPVRTRERRQMSDWL